jgi:hypothetical protein
VKGVQPLSNVFSALEDRFNIKYHVWGWWRFSLVISYGKKKYK